MTINSPRDIPNLLAWYSAQAVTGLADGAPLTTWEDQSGLGNHATGRGLNGGPTYKTTGGPGGGPSVQFSKDVTGSFFLPNLFGGTLIVGDVLPGDAPAPAPQVMATQAEVFAHIDADTTNNSEWAFNVHDGNNACYYPLSGTVYESFGTAVGSRQDFVPTLDTMTWRRYNVAASSAPSWTAWLDGVQQKTTTAAGTPNFTAVPKVGSGTDANAMWTGKFTTLLLFNRVLTTAERADVNAWLVANPSGGIYTPPPPPPGVPTEVRVENITATSAMLAWSPPVTGGTPTNYEVRITEVS